MARVNRILLLLPLLLCVVFALPAFAQSGRPGWLLLGTATVGPGPGPFTLQLPDDQQRAATRAMRFVAVDGNAAIERVVVAYANGQQQFEEEPFQIARGGETAVLAERDDPLVVDKVVISWRAGANAAPVKLEVWALRELAARPRAAMAGATDAKGYRELGVLFGTTRKRDADRTKNSRALATFTGQEGNQLLLGRAIVTIPIEREIGTLARPGFNFIFRVQFRQEDPKRHFTLAAVDVVNERDFIARLQNEGRAATRFRNQAFVFVHGYNVSFDDAIFRTAQIAHDVGFDGPAISFSWPSGGSWTSYRHDVDTSKGALAALRKLMELIATDTSITAVNLVAHSMGNAPVTDMLGTIGEIRRSGGNLKDLKLREIVLAAPDVSRTVFEQLAANFKGIASGGVTLYASAADKALLASKKLAGNLVRAGDVPAGGPVVVSGIETIDVTAASTSFFGSNHSHFADRESLVEDMRMLLEKGVRPPSKRFPVFKPVNSAAGQYWRYAE
jgi:esterase/lipase superfamily enzyme